MLDLTEKIYDKLPNDTVNKLKKAMYRAVDLIEFFFPHPKDVSKKIVLGPYQKDFIDTIQFGFPLSQFTFQEIPNPTDGVIYITRRQVGKSISCGYTSAALMILGATTIGHPPCFNGIIAASEEESNILIEKTKYCLEESDFNDFITGKPKLDKIKLINGSYTKSHTCSQKSIRGPSYHYTFIDESALMDESILFSAAIPTVEHGERWIAITTPQGSKGKLIEFYIKAVASRPIICKNCGGSYSQIEFINAKFPVKNQIWKMPNLPKCEFCGVSDYKYGIGTFATPYLDPWKTPIIDQEKLLRKMITFGWSSWARQEWLGEILDEASMVILQEWIDKNTNPRLRNIMRRNNENFYVLGMDYGRLHDASSFCITHKDKKTKKIILDYMRTVSGEYDFDTDYDKIHDHLKEIVMFYRPTLLILDSTGLGYSQVERVQKDLRVWGVNTTLYCNTKEKVKIGHKKLQRLGFIFSKKSKMDLIGNLISLLSDDACVLEIPPKTEPEISELITELLRFECEIMEAGYIKYGTQTYHDDRLIAYALSLWGHKSRKVPSAKPIGFSYQIYNKKQKNIRKIKYSKMARVVVI